MRKYFVPEYFIPVRCKDCTWLNDDQVVCSPDEELETRPDKCPLRSLEWQEKILWRPSDESDTDD